ncbi:hypothetical protein [Sporisorium scitamineum]|uniref:Uncharacterized protein n=1 Tax=Sporisorium scitamineum TaxID=49012 RepID=A0A0F7S701_9BASI|nr:hypothetical protein [Sporisorium scitamineum]
MAADRKFAALVVGARMKDVSPKSQATQRGNLQIPCCVADPRIDQKPVPE